MKNALILARDLAVQTPSAELSVTIQFVLVRQASLAIPSVAAVLYKVKTIHLDITWKKFMQYFF